MKTKYKYSRKKMEKELVDWKENSGSNKRFNGILMRFLSTLPQEEKKECEYCGSKTSEHKNYCYLHHHFENKGIDWSKKDIYDGINRPDLRPTQSPLDSLEEIEEIELPYNTNDSYDISLLTDALNILIRNQKKLYQFIKDKHNG